MSVNIIALMFDSVKRGDLLPEQGTYVKRWSGVPLQVGGSRGIIM